MSLKKALLAGIGTVSLGFGIVGVFLPVLPTTPFVLVAAACYGGGSRRLYDKLARTKFFGEYIENRKKHTGITRKTRAVSLISLWAMLILSMLMSRNPTVSYILLGVGAAVSVHILTIRRRKRGLPPEENRPS